MRNFKTNLIRRLARPRSKALIGRVSGGYSVSSKQNDGYVPVHDHAGQLVRPSILCIPAVPPGEDSVMDNEWAMYVDPSEAVDGEEPQPGGGGGGIDEDELWAILRDTGSETIAKNHLPSDVVYTEDIQDLLSDFATQDWVNSQGYLTEAALYGYATQDWVDDNFVRPSELPPLSKYLFWGTSVSPKQHVSVTDGNGTSRSLSLSTHTHDKDDITDFPTSWDWSDIDNTPTTLAGYGITDAYTDGEVDGLLGNYVTLDTAQEITGLKTFASLCTLAGGALVSGYLTIGAAAVNEDYPLYVGGDAWIGSCLGVTEGIDCQGYIAAGVLNIPSADGNRLYSLSVDPAGAVSGEDPDPIDEDALWAILQDTGTERISKNHLPSDVVYTEDIQDLGGGAVWYGQISSGGTVTKRGGTATLRVTHTTTGTYTVSGLTAANVAAVTPMYVASGSISPVQTAHSAVIVRSMASLTVHMFDKNGDKADYGFYLMAM